MSRLNDPENFRGRANYAAKVIAYGRSPTRAFDNCFKNHDSDEVATAIVRRSRKNGRLAANLQRYLSLSSIALLIGSPMFPRASCRRLPGRRAHVARPKPTPGSNSSERPTLAPIPIRPLLVRGAHHDPRSAHLIAVSHGR